MLTIKSNDNEKEIDLIVTLPEGHTAEELLQIAKNEISTIIVEGYTFGKIVNVNGRITTGIAMLLGHDLSHVCKQVRLFDPKENKYITVITH